MSHLSDLAVQPRGPYFLSILLTSSGIAALGAAYSLTRLGLEPGRMITAFVAVASIYVVTSIALSSVIRLSTRRAEMAAARAASEARALAALDELADLFAGKISSADMFRLAAARISDAVPAGAMVLYVYDEMRCELVASHYRNRDPRDHGENIIFPGEGIVGSAFTSGRTVMADGVAGGSDHPLACALPLAGSRGAFGVLQIFFNASFGADPDEVATLEAVAVRVSQLFDGAISFDRSQSSALIDPVTSLPNERGFFLVLENQVAEAQRRRGERPLTVLAIDISGFDETNAAFGHAAGDRLIAFAAATIKENLRQMDVVARAVDDEFLIVLPTADRAVSHEIQTRIRAALFGRRIAVTDTQATEIELNIGWAEFGVDGETPARLLSLAQLRKEQAKSSVSDNVLRFPEDLARNAN